MAISARLSLRLLRALLLLTWSIALAARSDAAQLAADDLAAIEKHLRADDDLQAAYDFVRARTTGTGRGVSRPLDNLLKTLDQARRYAKEFSPYMVWKGDVARIAGLYDLAIQSYQGAIARSAGDNSSPVHLSLYKAAKCAVLKRDFTLALSFLQQIEENNTGWVHDLGRRNAVLVMALAMDPDDVGQRIRFAREFWIDGIPAAGGDYADAIRLLQDTERLNPSREQLQQIYSAIAEYGRHDNHAALSEQYMEKMIAAFPVQDFVLEAALALSRFYFSKDQLPDAERWLEWIVAAAGDRSRFGPIANLALAEVHEKRGDDSAMARRLEMVAQAPFAAPTARSIMDTSNTREVAIVRLGNHYKARGRFEEALGYYRRWRPRHWGGNEQDQFEYERDWLIAECLVALGRSEEALGSHLWPHLRRDQGSLYTDTKIPELTVSLYAETGALERFLVEIEPHANQPHNATAQVARELALIRRMAEQGQIAALVGELVHRGPYGPRIQEDFIRESNWRAAAAANALAGLGGDTFIALRRRLQDLSTGDAAEKSYGDRVWVLYALGLSRSPDAERFLRELMARAQAGQRVGVEADDLRFALSLQTSK